MTDATAPHGTASTARQHAADLAGRAMSAGKSAWLAVSSRLGPADRQAPMVQGRSRAEGDIDLPGASGGRAGGADKGRYGAGHVFGLAEEARPQVAESAGEQTADLHLRDAELLADLGLGHATVITQYHESAARALGARPSA
jgi:hypothetical protein